MIVVIQELKVEEIKIGIYFLNVWNVVINVNLTINRHQRLVNLMDIRKMGRKYNSVSLSWIELHEKIIKLPKSVEEGTFDEDEAKEDVENIAEVGSRDSCIHYEIHEKKLTDEVKGS